MLTVWQLERVTDAAVRKYPLPRGRSAKPGRHSEPDWALWLAACNDGSPEAIRAFFLRRARERREQYGPAELFEDLQTLVGGHEHLRPVAQEIVAYFRTRSPLEGLSAGAADAA